MKLQFRWEGYKGRPGAPVKTESAAQENSVSYSVKRDALGKATKWG